MGVFKINLESLARVFVQDDNFNFLRPLIREY